MEKTTCWHTKPNMPPKQSCESCAKESENMETERRVQFEELEEDGMPEEHGMMNQTVV